MNSKRTEQIEGAFAALGFVVVLIAVIVVVTQIVSESVWAIRHFDGPPKIVRIVPTLKNPLYICADQINEEYKNCVSSWEVAEFAREYWYRKSQEQIRSERAK